MTEADEIARAYDAQYDDEPENECAPECACGSTLDTPSERGRGVCWACVDELADYAEDCAQIDEAAE